MTDSFPEKRHKKKGKRRKGKEFMDAVVDAYIRDQSLRKWREVDGLITGAGIDADQALRESAEFLEKGPYREIWRRWWGLQVTDGPKPDAGDRFAGIEAAVRGAVLEEKAERKQRQDPLLEDSMSYKEFVSRAMEQLLGEASGEIEDMD